MRETTMTEMPKEQPQGTVLSGLSAEHARQVFRALRGRLTDKQLAVKIQCNIHEARRYMREMRTHYDPVQKGGVTLYEILSSLAERELVRDQLTDLLEEFREADPEAAPKFVKAVLDIQKVAQKDDELKFRAMFNTGLITNALQSLKYGYNVKVLKWLTTTIAKTVYKHTTPEQRAEIRDGLNNEFEKGGWRFLTTETDPSSNPTTPQNTDEAIDTLHESLQRVDTEPDITVEFKTD